MADVEHRTVIVIGAGPAGTTCARRLAEANVDVLVLERREVVGHRHSAVNASQTGVRSSAPCWTGRSCLVGGNLRRPGPHQVASTGRHAGVPPSGHHYTFKLDAYAGHRPQFDGHLAERAEAGAEIRVGVALLRLQQQRKLGRELLVTSDGGRLTCDYLIDATGSLAHVGRMRHGKDSACRPAIRSRPCTRRFEERCRTCSMSSSAAWPQTGMHGSSRRPGHGQRRTRSAGGQARRATQGPPQDLCDNLDLEILEVGGGWIPMGGPVKRMVDGNALAVGDAAGLVMPSNGGGSLRPSFPVVSRPMPSSITSATARRCRRTRTASNSPLAARSRIRFEARTWATP